MPCCIFCRAVSRLRFKPTGVSCRVFLCRPCLPAALFREPPRFKGDLCLGYVAEPLHKERRQCAIPSRNHSASGFINLPSVIHHGKRAVSIPALPPPPVPLPLLPSQSKAGLIIGDSEDPRHHLPPHWETGMVGPEGQMLISGGMNAGRKPHCVILHPILNKLSLVGGH